MHANKLCFFSLVIFFKGGWFYVQKIVDLLVPLIKLIEILFTRLNKSTASHARSRNARAISSHQWRDKLFAF